MWTPSGRLKCSRRKWLRHAAVTVAAIALMAPGTHTSFGSDDPPEPISRVTERFTGDLDEVETIAAARVGSETVRYVANINKYFLAYTQVYRGNLQRELQIRSLKSAQHN